MYIGLLSKRTLVIISLFLFYSIKTLAQAAAPAPIIPNVVPSSPNMGALGVFGKIPVSFFTGVPDIAVPIYDVKYKDLNVPISIRYHNAIGNKADVMPGSLGMGWVLMAGGSISRISKELQNDDMPSGEPHLLGFNPTASDDWNTESLLNEYLRNNTYIVNDSIKYDVFYYNFLGHSGHIYFDQMNNPHIKSSGNDDFFVSIQILDQKSITMPVLSQGPANVPGGTTAAYNATYNHHNLLYKFELIDNSGVKYTFGGTDESIDFVRPGLEIGVMPGYANSGIIASAWQLTSIDSPNGYKISFEYKRGDIVVTKSSYSIRKVTTRRVAVSEEFPVDHVQVSSLTNPGYLTKIKTPQQTVEFTGSVADEQLHYPSNASALPAIGNKNYFAYYLDIRNANTENRFSEKLDWITVSDTTGLLYKKVVFNYTSSLNTRLKLLGLDIYGGYRISGTQQHYAFEYNALSLPGYLSFKTDHQGYFNNKVDIDSVNGFNHNFDNYYLTREPDGEYAVAEILKKIVFPTKGYTTFEFELNQYSAIASKWPFTIKENPGGTNLYTPGLRIKQMSSYDHTNALLDQKTYYYTKNFQTEGVQSSGILSYVPIYYEELNGTLTPPAQYASNTLNFNGEINVRVWNTNSINPVTATQGSHITYSEVVEKTISNGYTIYKYKNYDNGYPDIMPMAYVSDHTNIKPFWIDEPGSSMDLERGQLLEGSVYSATNELKLKTTYAYNDDPLRFNNYIRVVKKGINSLYSPVSGIPSIRFTASQVFYYYPFLKKKETFTYLDGIQMAQSEEYAYNSHRLIKEVKTKDSQGGIKSVQYDYPDDMISLGQDVPYQAMMDSNQVSGKIRERHYLNGVEKLNLFTKYKEWGVPNSRYLPEFSTRQQDEGVVDTLSVFYDYDRYGNPISFSRKNGSVSNYVWSYKGEFPIFEVLNVDAISFHNAASLIAPQDLLTKNPSDAELSNVENSLKSSFPSAQISTFSYYPLIGIKSLKDVKKNTTNYLYDDFLRLKFVKDQNGNIVKQYCYNYKDQIPDCDGNTFPPVHLNQMNTGYFASEQEFCTWMSSAMDYPVLALRVYSEYIGFEVVTMNGQPRPIYYSDPSTLTLTRDGIYTLWETEFGHRGYKYYYIQNGMFQHSGWCN